MLQRLRFILLIVALAAPAALHAAPSPAGNNPALEYEQVKKIALRDPKVRDAYERADARLDAKILEIDPTLRPYLNAKRLGPVKTDGPRPTASSARPPAPRSTPHPLPAPASHNRSHVVAKGETLSSIAVQTGVSVAELRRANHIIDDRKLAVGTALVIPAGKTVAAPPHDHTPTQPAKSKSSGISSWFQ